MNFMYFLYAFYNFAPVFKFSAVVPGLPFIVSGSADAHKLTD